ncbi:TPA: nucleotidyltransferase domain-containing protein [Candidatus Woesearchaeota archaeon]|nr:nucleotidyltransferase domain-containing protein [Candidatus Woesearchaeota archaeon]HII69192.1 nucleotidyltransferase domain-containing protein [Candidatus Woesearchaeota archaeon]
MDKGTEKKVRLFAETLRKAFQIERIILFGSRARGTHRRGSDYDFILVSPDFSKMKFTERISKIYPYWKFNDTIEPLCYTPEEFERLRNQITIVNEAVREGVQV